jgi:hypothetical protein
MVTPVTQMRSVEAGLPDPSLQGATIEVAQDFQPPTPANDNEHPIIDVVVDVGLELAHVAAVSTASAYAATGGRILCAPGGPLAAGACGLVLGTVAGIATGVVIDSVVAGELSTDHLVIDTVNGAAVSLGFLYAPWLIKIIDC